MLALAVLLPVKRCSSLLPLAQHLADLPAAQHNNPGRQTSGTRHVLNMAAAVFRGSCPARSCSSAVTAGDAAEQFEINDILLSRLQLMYARYQDLLAAANSHRSPNTSKQAQQEMSKLLPVASQFEQYTALQDEVLPLTSPFVMPLVARECILQAEVACLTQHTLH